MIRRLYQIINECLTLDSRGRFDSGLKLSTYWFTLPLFIKIVGVCIYVLHCTSIIARIIGSPASRVRSEWYAGLHLSRSEGSVPQGEPTDPPAVPQKVLPREFRNMSTAWVTALAPEVDSLTDLLDGLSAQLGRRGLWMRSRRRWPVDH
jgi:hypothetical protein